jgi:hypothetical protein
MASTLRVPKTSLIPRGVLFNSFTFHTWLQREGSANGVRPMVAVHIRKAHHVGLAPAGIRCTHSTVRSSNRRQPAPEIREPIVFALPRPTGFLAVWR